MYGKHDGFWKMYQNCLKYDVTLDIWLLNFGVRLPPPLPKGSLIEIDAQLSKSLKLALATCSKHQFSGATVL